jgi:hypothetical protein
MTASMMIKGPMNGEAFPYLKRGDISPVAHKHAPRLQAVERRVMSVSLPTGRTIMFAREAQPGDPEYDPRQRWTTLEYAMLRFDRAAEAGLRTAV